MDPTEILSHAEVITKAGAALTAAIPFTALVKRILGPAADEIAERARDEIRVYRYGRQLSLLHKAEQMAAQAGFTPKAVPVKLLFSLLDGASLEESEDLHSRWASLLANAANPVAAVPVRPSFTSTLRLLTPEGARFLDAVYQRALAGAGVPTISPQDAIPELRLVSLGSYDSLFSLFGQTGLTSLPPDLLITSESKSDLLKQDAADRDNFAILMNELRGFQMWSVAPSRSSGDRFYLSTYAVHFLTACHPPEP